MDDGTLTRIGAALGEEVARTAALGGGCVGDVVLVTLRGGRRVVVKRGEGMGVESRSIALLASHGLPCPKIHVSESDLLVMEHVEHDGNLSGGAEEDAAAALASLHGATAERYGLDFDARIGGLVQPNGWMASWPAFYGERRLLPMARGAHEAGRVGAGLVRDVETLAGRLSSLIPERPAASLLHGDVWSGNVLARGGRVAAFIDPAPSYGDAEVELAFIAMFGTFGDRFFERYATSRPIAPGFWEERRAIYTLYPLLVHARLFGGHYVAQVERLLTRFVGRSP